MKQYFEQYSSEIQTVNGVNVKILEPFEIEVSRVLYDSQCDNSFELCVSFKQPKRFMDAFNLNCLDEIKTITCDDLVRVWKSSCGEEKKC